PGSLPLQKMPFRQARIAGIFHRGFLFYAEFNIRLFFYLVWKRVDVICAIDLDTIIPCYMISVLKKILRVYDAHELFCVMKEVVSRPRIYTIWKWIKQKTVPRFKSDYTANSIIANEFHNMYGLNYAVIRNITKLSGLTIPVKTEKYLLYQG